MHIHTLLNSSLIPRLYCQVNSSILSTHTHTHKHTLNAPQDFDDIPSQRQQQQQLEEEGGEVGGGGGAGEEWEDDGWEAFEEPLEKPKATAAMSSGPDFFDTFQGSVSTTTEERKSENFFTSYGAASSSRTTSGRKERSPPLPVASSLFETKDKTPEREGGGWDDWGVDFTEKPAHQVWQINFLSRATISLLPKLSASFSSLVLQTTECWAREPGTEAKPLE